MSRAWGIFEADSRSLELAVALVGLSFAMSCAFGNWFGGWLPQASFLGGLEPIAAALGFVFNGVHMHCVFSGNIKCRQVFAITNAVLMTVLSCVIFSAYGWLLPAGPVLATGSFINAWIYLSLHSDRVDAAHWSRRR